MKLEKVRTTIDIPAPLYRRLKRHGITISRVDGRLTVTGRATYAAEFDVPGLAYGAILRSTVASGRIAAYAFTVRRDNRDYAGRLSLDEAAGIIVAAVGGRGTGRDYLANTVRHLEELGIADGPLHRLEERVNALGDSI